MKTPLFAACAALCISAPAFAQQGPEPRFPFTHTARDIAVIEQVFLKQTTIPGEVWIGTYESMEQQKFALIQKEQVRQPLGANLKGSKGASATPTKPAGPKEAPEPLKTVGTASATPAQQN